MRSYDNTNNGFSCCRGFLQSSCRKEDLTLPACLCSLQVKNLIEKNRQNYFLIEWKLLIKIYRLDCDLAAFAFSPVSGNRSYSCANSRQFDSVFILQWFLCVCLVAKSYLLPVYPPPGPWRSSGSIWGCATLSGEFDWMVEKSRWWSLCVHQLSKHIFILLQVAGDSCLSLTGLSEWVALEVSQNYILGMGFFICPPFRLQGVVSNLNPARSLHELKVFGSHRVLRTCRALCAVLCSVTTITLVLCWSWFFP